ncbi:hypothetical protein BGZ58_006616 [Dissophora ornata]|nr:hypothetical protein BGZ58_006616 [Dissophora ornata]
MATVLKSAYAFYNRQYQARPILTICTTNAILAGISDTLTQKYLAPAATKSSLSTSSHLKEDARELAQDIELTLHEPHSSVKTTKDAVDLTTSHGEQAVKDKNMPEGHMNGGQEIIQSDYQAIEEHQPTSDSTSISTPSLDFARMGRFMFYNFSVAPLIHTWYSFLEKNFPINITSPSSSVNSSVKSLPAPSSRLIQTMTPALKRMVADQTLFAPAGLALLFTGLTVLEGGGVQEIKDKLNNNYLTTLKANYAVWPIVQLVNFSLMPLQLRLPFVSVIRSLPLEGTKLDSQQDVNGAILEGMVNSEITVEDKNATVQ